MPNCAEIEHDARDRAEAIIWRAVGTRSFCLLLSSPHLPASHLSPLTSHLIPTYSLEDGENVVDLYSVSQIELHSY